MTAPFRRADNQERGNNQPFLRIQAQDFRLRHSRTNSPACSNESSPSAKCLEPVFRGKSPIITPFPILNLLQPSPINSHGAPPPCLYDTSHVTKMLPSPYQPHTTKTPANQPSDKNSSDKTRGGYVNKVLRRKTHTPQTTEQFHPLRVEDPKPGESPSF